MSGESYELEFRPEAAQAVDTRPWPRYFARMLDVLIFAIVMMSALVIPLAITDPVAADRALGLMDGVGGTLLSNIVSPLLALLPVALLLTFGQTPGKWLFGIRVRARDGRRMTLMTAIKREFLVWVRGLGLGLPVVSLYTLVMSHGDLKNEGTTPWDRSLGLSVEHAAATPFWWIRATLGAAIVLATTFWGIVDMIASAGR